MSALTLNLTKPGEAAPKLALNLVKDEKFTVKLSWDGKTDLDLHALHCIGQGNNPASITALEQILSTYNVSRVIAGQQQGTLAKQADGSFSISNGALVHSPDATDGNAEGVDEYIVVDPGKIAKIAGQYSEIPLIAMIHPQSAGLTFANVQNAQAHIVNSKGETLLDINLSSQFGQFIGVQMGAIMIDDQGKATFHAVGSGFSGDFNSVIGHFG